MHVPRLSSLLHSSWVKAIADCNIHVYRVYGHTAQQCFQLVLLLTALQAGWLQLLVHLVAVPLIIAYQSSKNWPPGRILMSWLHFRPTACWLCGRPVAVPLIIGSKCWLPGRILMSWLQVPARLLVFQNAFWSSPPQSGSQVGVKMHL